MKTLRARSSTLLSLALLCGCAQDAESKAGGAIREGTCQIGAAKSAPDFLQTLTCTADFTALASVPIDANLPGARSVKVVLDQADHDHLYFQNSKKYQIHYQFASAHLSGHALPIVPALSDFNASEYYKPDRRFLLGAVTYYDEPKVWALEIAPYDTASVAMVEKLYAAVREASFFGPALTFHPTSDSVVALSKKLSTSVKVKTTDQLYAEIDYQPLTLATGVGRLHFMKAADLATQYVSFRDILVLDEVPNDISVIAGLITQEFQTPLAHVNVLSQNRHTPNMGLRNALKNAELLKLEGKWVELTVGATSYSVKEVSTDVADAFWEAHRPPPVVLPALDLSVHDIVDIEAVTPETLGVSLREAITKAVLAYGGKAAHYSLLARTTDVPIKKAFAIPVFYYDQFMKENGLFDRVDALIGSADFQNDPAVRDTSLADLRSAMMAAPVNEDFQSALKAKLQNDYPGITMRFRTSTNSEDLAGFPCAGCYESHTGDPADWADVLKAIRKAWASIWLFRTFEERSYYGVDHKSVGMGLLVHHNFPDEEANGVAVTANPFDASGLDPALYVNVQRGGTAEVVHPPPGVASDQFLYYFGSPNQPIAYISHSSLVETGESVLTNAQVHRLGIALAAIHERFSPAYGPGSGNAGFYAMDVEFKFDDEAAPGQAATLYVKQARPYPGRGSEPASD